MNIKENLLRLPSISDFPLHTVSPHQQWWFWAVPILLLKVQRLQPRLSSQKLLSLGFQIWERQETQECCLWDKVRLCSSTSGSSVLSHCESLCPQWMGTFPPTCILGGRAQNQLQAGSWKPAVLVWVHTSAYGCNQLDDGSRYRASSSAYGISSSRRIAVLQLEVTASRGDTIKFSG